MVKRQTPGQVLLLDTSAFILGYMATDVDAEHFSTPAVRDELTEGSIHRLRFDNAAQNGYLKVISPDPRFLKKLSEVAREMGEESALSAADAQLLALGLSLQSQGNVPMVVSDDYSVQNMANRLGFDFKSLATPGIKQRFEWIVYCPGCRREFEELQRGNTCPICGTELKRKPGEKKKLR
jgi:rRNA maturation endonuclease Nob1